MPTAWGGGSGMSREDSRGFRRDEGLRARQADSWIASRDGPVGGRDRDRERGRQRDRERSRSPHQEIKDQEPEVKYGRR
jgi:hypothetical protein